MFKILIVVSTLLCPIVIDCVENYNNSINMEEWEKDCRNIREHQLEYSQFYVDKTILTCKNKQEYVDYKEREQMEIDKIKQEKEEIRQEEQEKRQKIYNIYSKEKFEKTYHSHVKLSKTEVYESKNYKITVNQTWEKFTYSTKKTYPDKTTVKVEKNGEIIYNFEF